MGWAGAPVVGPSVTVVHCNAGDEATTVAALNTFFNAIKAQVPTGVQWNAPTSGDTLDELSGHRNGAWSIGASGPTAATGSSIDFPNGVGLRIRFPTIGVVAGRSVVGAMFIVPLISTAYEGPGNIKAATLTAISTAAITLATTPNGLRVYSRPSSTHGGISFPALTAQVPDAVSWLRSRRT